MGHVEQEVDITAPALTAEKIGMALACNLFSMVSFIQHYIYIYTHRFLADVHFKIEGEESLLPSLYKE